MEKYMCIKENTACEIGEKIYISPENPPFCGIYNEKINRIGTVHVNMIRKYFKPVADNITDECTIAKEESYKTLSKSCNNTYKGWEIVEMLEDGELPIGAEIIGYSKDCDIKHYFLVDNEAVIRDQLTEEEISISFLVGCDFEIIKPKKLVSFTEALQQGLNIKHKDWKTEYTTPQNILNHYTKMSNEDISKDLFGNEKVWEVQE